MEVLMNKANKSFGVDMIAVDGGPCGGKTTGMVRLVEACEKAGIIPIVVPEAATMLMESGIDPMVVGIEEFQKLIVFTQLAHEEIYLRAGEELASREKTRVVIFCDRGVFSSAAYLPDQNPLENFAHYLPQKHKGSLNEILSRYSGVIHMMTAADGAEEYYTLANNGARKETPEQARHLDIRTQRAWLGHPKLCVVGNIDSDGEAIAFDQKIHNAEVALWRIIGHPEPVEVEDKFLLGSFDPAKLPVPHEAVRMYQTYLSYDESKPGRERVRVRLWRGQATYVYTRKIARAANEGGGNFEHEELISERRYHALRERACPERNMIEKTRYCFLYEGQYFEVDVFAGKLEGLVLAEREKTDQNDTTRVPPFLDVVRDVTDDPEYANSHLAKK